MESPQIDHAFSSRLSELETLLGSEAFKDLVDTSLKEIPKRIEELRTALEDRNTKAIQVCAHKLKGDVSVFDLSQLVSVCQTLEATTRETPFNQGIALLRTIEQSFAAATPLLSKHL